MESGESSDQEDEPIIQLRQALTCPDADKFEVFRKASFLNYTTTSLNDDVFELPLEAFLYKSQAVDSKKWTEKISFSGWISPSTEWIEWVNAMAESHATVWKESGVHDAIMASRYEIKKEEELIMALVEKWCVDTNTFVFPWGEATVTLEDLIILGGFSVVGNSPLDPIQGEDIEEKLKKAKREIEANFGEDCSVSSWMKEMMNSGNEIEHEAFMVSWLSTFVFPDSSDLLIDKLFSPAIQLAKGVKVALAPAVLARIYSDLGVLREYLAGYSEKDTVLVKSPLQFVQVWALERFMELQPPGQPRKLEPGEPRIARWHHHGCGGGPCNIRGLLDSARDSFDYRPYTKPLNNFKFPNFYLEDDCWISVTPDESIIAFARCIRVSKLVGLDCIEPYYPHRVALQFGYDQDVPALVPGRIETAELAWKDYNRPISDRLFLYIPARFHEGDVTVEYIRWWKLSVAVLQSEAKKISHKLLTSTPKPKPVATPSVTITTDTKETCFPSGSLVGSKQAMKQPIKMPEWVQRPSPKLKNRYDISSARASNIVKDLKGSPMSSEGTNGQANAKSLPSMTHTLSLNQNDSPVKKPRILPQVSKEPNISQSLSGSHGSYQNSPSPLVSTEPIMSTSLSNEIETIWNQGEEGDEVTCQRPRRQFEELIKDFLQDLESIKLAFNMPHDDDDDDGG